MSRPPCPTCHGPIRNVRPTPGVVAAYPCGCWLTPAQAARIAAAIRHAQEATR